LESTLQVSLINNSDAPMVRTLTRKQASEQLQISVSMLDLLTKKGRIRVCKIGRRRVYLPIFLEEFCERSRRQKQRDGPSAISPGSLVRVSGRVRARSNTATSGRTWTKPRRRLNSPSRCIAINQGP
jgi:hypothetical protein